MASMEEAIVAFTTARASLNAAFGDRVYDRHLPSFSEASDAYPALTFQMVSSTPLRHSTGECEAHEVSVQFDVWALDAAACRSAKTALRDALTVWAGPFGGITITRGFKDSDFDGSEDWGDSGPLPVFRNTQRWTFWIREPSAVSL